MSLERAEIKQEGWNVETTDRSQAISDFLKEYFKKSLSDFRARYESSELHFSGTNVDLMPQIQQGIAHIERIDVLYQSGKITQIHVVFGTENLGNHIDVYFTGRALEDYMSK